jgi:fatty-acyl-CoA synthase
MVGRLIQVTKSAYQYPLIFKQLWHTPLLQAPDQEIVYRDLSWSCARNTATCSRSNSLAHRHEGGTRE